MTEERDLNMSEINRTDFDANYLNFFPSSNQSEELFNGDNHLLQGSKLNLQFLVQDMFLEHFFP